MDKCRTDTVLECDVTSIFFRYSHYFGPDIREKCCADRAFCQPHNSDVEYNMIYRYALLLMTRMVLEILYQIGHAHLVRLRSSQSADVLFHARARGTILLVVVI